MTMFETIETVCMSSIGLFGLEAASFFDCGGLYCYTVVAILSKISSKHLCANRHRCNPFVSRFTISNDYGFSENEWFSSEATAINKQWR